MDVFDSPAVVAVLSFRASSTGFVCEINVPEAAWRFWRLIKTDQVHQRKRQKVEESQCVLHYNVGCLIYILPLNGSGREDRLEHVDVCPGNVRGGHLAFDQRGHRSDRRLP